MEEFQEAVDMSARELEDWSKTDESREVGRKDGGESKGHESGRRIVEILGKYDSDYTEEDVSRMRSVVSYVYRHRAREPQKEEIETFRWRYGLMNRGHDPLK